jgi:HAD superfamily hydrolase (TIGR01509 family)
MKPQAVIFDRDGVLTYFDIDFAISFLRPLLPISLYELSDRWEDWGAQIGFPSTLEQEREFFASFWRQLHQELDLTDAQYSALASCNYTDFMRPFPEVAEVLQELQRRGVAIGVLSNFSLASLESSLEAVGILDWIDVACAAMVIGHSKPQPEAYRHVADLLHVQPEAALFFDDEAPCVAGAHALGMRAYLVDRQREHDDRANRIVHNLHAALDLL